MTQQFYFWVYIKRIESKVLKKYLYTHVYNSIIHNSQKVETTQMSTDRWMDKQNVAYVYNEYYSVSKERESGIYYNMVVSWGLS